MTQRHLLGVSVVAGVGFTVAIFVSNLAFADAEQVELAKLAVMLGSVVAAAAGYAVLRLSSTADAPTPHS